MAIRWRGYEHPELYEMINAGPGAAASEPQTSYWTSLAEELATVDEDLNTSLNGLGASWEGKAAESATTGLTPLAAWATDAQTGSDVMKISSENQAEYISDARAKMPEPVEVTTQAPSNWAKVAAGAALLTGNAAPAVVVAAQAADHEAQESAQSEAEERALETMQTYESSSTWNRDTLGTFVAPPDVVVSTPAPQGTGTGNAVLLNTRKVNVDQDSSSSNGSNGSSGSNGGNGNGNNRPPIITDGGVDQPPTNGGGGGNGGGNGNGVPTLPGSNLPPGSSTSPSDVIVQPPGAGPFPPGINPGPGPNPPGPGPNPYPPGLGPFPPGAGPNDNNASDIARRPLPPLRPGLPPTPGLDPLGRGGGFPPGGQPFGGQPLGPRGGLPGGGPGGLGGIDGERAPSQLGRGGVLGGAPENVVRSGPGAAGAAGARGNGVNGPAGPGGRRGEGEEDDEHYSPDYLLEPDDVFGDDRRVAPNVIGE